MTGNAEQGWKRLAEAIKRATGLVAIDPEELVHEGLGETERSMATALESFKSVRGAVKEAVEQAIEEISEEVARSRVAWAYASFVIDKLAQERGLRPGSKGYNDIWDELKEEFAALSAEEIALHVDSSEDIDFDVSYDPVAKILAAYEAMEQRGVK